MNNTDTAPLYYRFQEADEHKVEVDVDVEVPCSSSLTIKTASSNFPYQKIISFNESFHIRTSSCTTPSSAFVSALQSPYVSPRLTANSLPEPSSHVYTATSNHQSKAGSQCDDIPSSSYTYTPPTDIYEYSDEPTDPKIRVFKDLETMHLSFPASRIMKGLISPVVPSNAKLRNCDVFIGFHGQNPNLARFCKWLKSELELQGIASFIADRAKYTDHQSHEIADCVICSVTHGIVVITDSTFMNHLSIDEIRFFAQKRNLIPVWFDTSISEITEMLKRRSSVDKECQEAIDAVVKSNEFKLEARDGNWRRCMSKAAAVHLLGTSTSLEEIRRSGKLKLLFSDAGRV